ncbi:hypothetical protein [Dactylosporangium sp. CA-139066]|uniref:hypothetical protein n=1 Tax=Dactylosporangium sp. CA-139066 TaxID=3239930 RepID=UPI003D931450
MSARRRSASRPDTTVGRLALRRPALSAGQLYAMVLAYLRAHPTLAFSPAELANAPTGAPPAARSSRSAGSS